MGIAVKILGRQKGKNAPDLYSQHEGKREKAMPSVQCVERDKLRSKIRYEKKNNAGDGRAV